MIIRFDQSQCLTLQLPKEFQAVSDPYHPSCDEEGHQYLILSTVDQVERAKILFRPIASGIKVSVFLKDKNFYTTDESFRFSPVIYRNGETMCLEYKFQKSLTNPNLPAFAYSRLDLRALSQADPEAMDLNNAASFGQLERVKYLLAHESYKLYDLLNALHWAIKADKPEIEQVIKDQMKNEVAGDPKDISVSDEGDIFISGSEFSMVHITDSDGAVIRPAAYGGMVPSRGSFSSLVSAPMVTESAVSSAGAAAEVVQDDKSAPAAPSSDEVAGASRIQKPTTSTSTGVGTFFDTRPSLPATTTQQTTSVNEVRL